MVDCIEYAFRFRTCAGVGEPINRFSVVTYSIRAVGALCSEPGLLHWLSIGIIRIWMRIVGKVFFIVVSLFISLLFITNVSISLQTYRSLDSSIELLAHTIRAIN